MKTLATCCITVVACLGCCLSFLTPAAACTGIRLTAKDGTPVYARTLELGGDLNSNIIVVPRGYAFLLSDNRANAVSSGPGLVPVSQVLGKVKL